MNKIIELVRIFHPTGCLSSDTTIKTSTDIIMINSDKNSIRIEDQIRLIQERNGTKIPIYWASIQDIPVYADKNSLDKIIKSIEKFLSSNKKILTITIDSTENRKTTIEDK